MTRSLLVALLAILALLTGCSSEEDESMPDARPPAPDARAASCKGLSESCFTQKTRFSCTTIEGCSVIADERCGGVARSCSDYRSAGLCGLQPGCRWNGSTCGGFSSCILATTITACASTEGCEWRDIQCGGASKACSEYTSPVTCGGQPGCRWE